MTKTEETHAQEELDVETPVDGRNVYERLADVMADVPAIGKSAKNEASGYSARSIDDVMDVMHQLFARHRLVLLPHVEWSEYVERSSTNDRGKTSTVVDARLRIRFEFVAPDGTSVSMTTQSEGRDYSDKSTNKAASNALKYALLHAFLIPISEFDSDTETIEVFEPQVEAPPPSAVAALTSKNPDARARAHIFEYVNRNEAAARTLWSRVCTEVGLDPEAIVDSDSDADLLVAKFAELTGGVDG